MRGVLDFALQYQLGIMMIPALLLTGCGKKSDGERAEELLTEVRGEYLEAAVCTGQAAITANYGQQIGRASCRERV